MDKKEYFQHLAKAEINHEKVQRVYSVYKMDLPETVRKIVSNSDETVFFDNDIRILSMEEIMNADRDLHVNFVERGMIPIADCGENDFIVYHSADRMWSKFNIIDEIAFRKKNSVEELIN